jgi:hypothetical protein
MTALLTLPYKQKGLCLINLLSFTIPDKSAGGLSSYDAYYDDVDLDTLYS